LRFLLKPMILDIRNTKQKMEVLSKVKEKYNKYLQIVVKPSNLHLWES